MLSESDINALLYFGYQPKQPSGLLDDLMLSKKAGEPFSDSMPLIELGAAALRQAFERTISATNNALLHVVPLSGGIDSRVILGSLLQLTGADRIRVLTFGSPGTWDFDIGRLVARELRVKAESIDLTSSQWDWSTAALVRSASRLSTPAWIMDRHVNGHLIEKFSGSVRYWSGFMGDPLAGSHLTPDPSVTWAQALEHFCDTNRFDRGVKLHNSSFQPSRLLPRMPLADETQVNFDEQLDFAVRQDGPIRETVMPCPQRYVSPFLAREWVSFILNAPEERRWGQVLYRDIVGHAFPVLAALPTKNLRGLPLTASGWQRRVAAVMRILEKAQSKLMGTANRAAFRAVNYIDFDEALRSDRRFREMARENLNDLRRRDVCGWVDIESLWRAHDTRGANLGRALTLLISLEVFLKAKEKAP